MKKYLVALGTMAMISTASFAQDKSAEKKSDHTTTNVKRHHKGHGQSQMMSQLNLSDQQKQEAKSIREDYQAQVKQLESDKSFTQQQLKEKKATLQKSQREKFQSILTDDQRAKMLAMKSSRKHEGKKMSGDRMEKIKSELTLSEEQETQLQAQHEAFKKDAVAIRENKSLTEDQKKSQLMELRKSQRDSEEKILTAEQLEKLKEIKTKRMEEMKDRDSKRS